MHSSLLLSVFLLFFFNDTATTEIYTLSLHDALPIYPRAGVPRGPPCPRPATRAIPDRKSTRLNSSHHSISYAVFCLKKKNNNPHPPYQLEKSKQNPNTIKYDDHH